MASTVCARFLLPRNPPLLPLLARLPARSPTTSAFRLQFQQLRHASKRAHKSAPKKKILPPPPSPAAIKTASPQSQTPKYIPLSEQLATSGKEKIILYACSNRLFIFGCYGLVTGMVAWSVYTWNTNIANQRPGVPRWITGASYASITIMMLLAGVVAYYPTRIIQIIHAHPIPGTARTAPRISITLHRRPILPTLPMKKIHVSSSDLISLEGPLQPVLRVSGSQPEMEDKRSAVTKIRHSITGAPFKVFDFFRKALSTGGFALLRVEGMGSFRLSKDGWVWERRGLDRLFRMHRK